MKTKFLAFLLCLILVASSCLFAGCGKKNEEKEVVAAEERTATLASFFKGMEELRKTGIVFTGTVKGSETAKDGTVKPIDLTLSLKYFNQTFAAIASGKVDGGSGTYEVFFDGSVLASLDQTVGKETEYDVDFVEDALKKIPALGTGTSEDGAFSALSDQIVALIDLDKVAAKLEPASSGIVVIKKSGSTYTVTVTSDAIFDAALSVLNTVKGSGDKKVSELFDALVGAGSFEKLMTELEKYSGSDKVSTLVPVIEAQLADCGVKVDSVYEFVGKLITNTECTADQVRGLLYSYVGEMTIDDALALGTSKANKSADDPADVTTDGEGVSEGEGTLYGEDGTVGEAYEGGDEEGYGFGDEDAAEEDIAAEGAGMFDELTYDGLVAMLAQFAGMKVNDLLAAYVAPDFNLDATLTPVIAKVEACKQAINCTLSVTCDKKLNPTEIALNLSVDTTKLPADFEADPATVTMEIKAEVKSSVTVAPSAALKAKIEEEAAKRTAPAAD